MLITVSPIAWIPTQSTASMQKRTGTCVRIVAGVIWVRKERKVAAERIVKIKRTTPRTSRIRIGLTVLYCPGST